MQQVEDCSGGNQITPSIIQNGTSKVMKKPPHNVRLFASRNITPVELPIPFILLLAI